MTNLVLVESPSKAKTIKKYLGRDYVIKATFGHVRDLPKKELGIEVENNFHPDYQIIPRSKKNIDEIKKEADNANTIYLATDFDREGEAIAWHVTEACKLPQNKIKRITFVEITKEALQEAVANPRNIDMNLVDAQQARRILDRLVGYKLSPLLWQKIKSRLSAGRVQSVAVRLVVEREREIEAFKPEEYWEIEGEFSKKQKTNNKQQITFKAKLIKIGEKKVEIKNNKEADSVVKDLEEGEYKIQSLEKKEVTKYPFPPFTTSTMQQDASYKLGFSAKKTMLIAQQLYEGVELGKDGRVGLITYMRTDSVNLSWLAINTARKYIEEKIGKEYLPEKPRGYKTKTAGAQEAHEAIRPTYIDKDPENIKEFLSEDQYKLYKLIWQRMLACQMVDASFEETIAEIEAKCENEKYLLEARGLKCTFLGFYKAYSDDKKENLLPPLSKDEQLDMIKIDPLQKFTQPPYRYTEATLIKELEENGIGRPSTYAPIISTIQDRGYVAHEGKFLKPTEIGNITNDFLVLHFPKIVDLHFTSEMEKSLDEIAVGTKNYIDILGDFYDPFIENLEEKKQTAEKIHIEPEKTDQKCDKCGKDMVIREGRFGRFMACSGFPECKNTKAIVGKVEVPCPYCGGEIKEKRTRKRKVFYGCENYPECKFAAWDLPTDMRCSKCDGMMTKKGKILICIRCKNREVLKDKD